MLLDMIKFLFRYALIVSWIKIDKFKENVFKGVFTTEWLFVYEEFFEKFAHYVFLEDPVKFKKPWIL